MYNPDTEILFPLRVLPSLKLLRGDSWQNLVEYIGSKESNLTDRYAFVLMMVRMCGCVGCNADSFRAMRGCSQCARQTVRRSRNSEQEILEQFALMHNEVVSYLKKNETESTNS